MTALDVHDRTFFAEDSVMSSHQFAIDPVCGMRVDPSVAADTRMYRGTTYHFCSAWCAKKFDADAAAYIAASQQRGDDDASSIDDPHP